MTLEDFDVPFDGYFAERQYVTTFAKNIVHEDLYDLGLEPLLRNGPLVELGCGLGTFLEILGGLRPDLKMIGIDGRSTYLDEARTRINQNTELRQARFDNLPFPNSSVPLIYSHRIYQYCNEKSYPEIAREISRVLKSGGVYISVEGMKEYKHAFIEAGLISLIDDDYNIGVFRKENGELK